MSKQVLSFTKRREIADYLDKVITKVGDGYVAYDESESDHAVAERFGCNKFHVATLRMELHGKVRLPKQQSLEDRFRALEDRVRALEMPLFGDMEK